MSILAINNPSLTSGMLNFVDDDTTKSISGISGHALYIEGGVGTPGFSPIVDITNIAATTDKPSGVNVKFTYGDAGEITAAYNVYDGVAGAPGVAGASGRSTWVSDIKTIDPTTEHENGGSAFTIHFEDTAYNPQQSTITIWNGNNGVNGVDGKDGAPGEPGTDGKDGTNGVDGTPGKNGTSPEVSIQSVTGSDDRIGTKVIFTYGDELTASTSYTAWNGKDGEAGSLPIAPADAGEYLLHKTDSDVSWTPYTEPVFDIVVTGENGISAKKENDTIYVGLSAETTDMVGSGSVTITSNAAGQVVISGQTVDTSNFVTSAGLENNTQYSLTTNGWSAISTETSNTTFTSGTTVNYDSDADTFTYIPAKIEDYATATAQSAAWAGDNTLHFILEN